MRVMISIFSTTYQDWRSVLSIVLDGIDFDTTILSQKKYISSLAPAQPA